MKCEPKYEAAGFLEFEATHVAAEMLLDPSLAPIPTTLLYAGIANLVYETTCLSYFFLVSLTPISIHIDLGILLRQFQSWSKILTTYRSSQFQESAIWYVKFYIEGHTRPYACDIGRPGGTR